MKKETKLKTCFNNFRPHEHPSAAVSSFPTQVEATQAGGENREVALLKPPLFMAWWDQTIFHAGPE